MEIQSRLKAVRNMNIIIWTIALTVGYTTLYTIVYTFFSNDQCYVSDTVWMRSLSTFLERSIQYIWWMYPILWLFWPNEIRCLRICYNKRKRRSFMHSTTEITNNSVMGQTHHTINSDHEKSSDEDDYGEKPKQTMIKIEDGPIAGELSKTSPRPKTGVLVQNNNIGQDFHLSMV